MIMEDVESDEHLRIFKCLIDTGSLVLRNAIGNKVLKNNSIGFVQYLEHYKHQFYHQFEKNISRKCCQGNPHGCTFNGIMDKKIFYKMYNKTAEQNSRDCLDRFETNAGISLDSLDLSDLNFFLWNSSSLSPQEEHSLKKIMSIRSAICHPSSSHSYSIDELKIYWSDLKSAVLLFAEPKCYKDIVEIQVKTLQNCKLNVIESAKVIEKMKIESNKILHAIKQENPLKIVDIEKLMKDGTRGFENCVKSENNKTQSCIKDTLQKFKENIEKHHEVLSTSCREKIQTTVTQESSNIRLHSEDQSHAIDTKLTDLMEENRQLKAEVINVQTDIKELRTIMIGYIGKQKVDLIIRMEQIEKSTKTPDNGKVEMTVKVNQTHVTEDKENEIIENLPPEIEIPTYNDSSPAAVVTETIEITGKKVNSIILELKATPGILHSVENFRAAILKLVQVMQTARGIDVEIEDTITVNLKFESPLTEDQFAVVKCLFPKEWNEDNDTTLLPETSEVFQLETTKPITKTFCQLCDNKDKIIKALEEQNEKHEIVIKRNMLDLQAEKRKQEDDTDVETDLLKKDVSGMMYHVQSCGKNIENPDTTEKEKDNRQKHIPFCRGCEQKDIEITQLEKSIREGRWYTLERFIDDTELEDESEGTDSDYMTYQSSASDMDPDISYGSDKKGLFSKLNLIVNDVFEDILRHMVQSTCPKDRLPELSSKHFLRHEQRAYILKEQWEKFFNSLGFNALFSIVQIFRLFGYNDMYNYRVLGDHITDDLKRIRMYRYDLVQCSNIDIEKSQLDYYASEFPAIGQRIDAYFNQKTNYADRITEHLSPSSDIEMQSKYDNALSEMTTFKLKIQNPLVSYYWGDSFESNMRNIKWLLKDGEIKGIEKVHLKIHLEKKDDQTTADILKYLHEEVDSGLTDIEIIV